MNDNEQHRRRAGRRGRRGTRRPRPPRSRVCSSTDDVSPLPSDTGYRGPTACNAAGITYRQLDYWARTGLVEPTVRGATGSGTQRLYSFRDILMLKVIKRLLDAGISLQQIRTAVQHLRARGTDDLTRVTLMSDGASVYECTSNDEVIDLLQGGQGVFGIAIGGVWREIEGTLAELPERAHGRGRRRRPRRRRARRPPRAQAGLDHSDSAAAAGTEPAAVVLREPGGPGPRPSACPAVDVGASMQAG